MKTFLAVLALFVMAQAASGQTVYLTAGDYAWDNPWGCSGLTVGASFAYSYDDGCDGSVDYQANTVRLEGNRIQIDDAYLEIQSADENQIEGVFHFNGANPAVFIRQ